MPFGIVESTWIAEARSSGASFASKRQLVRLASLPSTSIAPPRFSEKFTEFALSEAPLNSASAAPSSGVPFSIVQLLRSARLPVMLTRPRIRSPIR